MYTLCSIVPPSYVLCTCVYGTHNWVGDEFPQFVKCGGFGHVHCSHGYVEVLDNGGKFLSWHTTVEVKKIVNDTFLSCAKQLNSRTFTLSREYVG